MIVESLVHGNCSNKHQAFGKRCILHRTFESENKYVWSKFSLMDLGLA
jgi:hypothetical protein